jgi:hypothetical protein
VFCKAYLKTLSNTPCEKMRVTSPQAIAAEDSKSLIGRERDPVQFAVLWVKVGHGVVLGRTVVPHGQ